MRGAQAPAVVLALRPPVTFKEGARRRAAGTGAMPSELDPPTPSAVAGVVHRPAGQARALARAASYVGFTAAVPDVAAASEVLLATARESGLSLAALRVLIALLRLLPRWRWHGPGPPILRATNQRIADAAGCGHRTAQRGLRQLHEQGTIAIRWGRGNTRLPYRQDGQDEDELIGIDLRPALVLAVEMAARLRAREAALRAFRAARADAAEAILGTRVAVDAAARPATACELRLAQVAELRRRLQAAAGRAHRPGATATAIEAATATVRALAAEAEGLRQDLASEDEPDGGGEGHGAEDDAGDSGTDLATRLAAGGDQRTESTPVEIHVRTDQGEGRTAGKGWGRAGAADDPAEPLLLARWRRGYDGTLPLTGDDWFELEITCRQRASRMGVGTPAFNAGVARHGLHLAMGAVLHVSALPERAGVRSKAALLVSLLQRAPGQLTPATFHRRPAVGPPVDPELGEGEALRIVQRTAPSHQPGWVLRRWAATRQRRGEPIHDPRRCLAAFAAKLEREQGRAA